MERAGGEVVCSSPAADTIHPKNRANHSDTEPQTHTELSPVSSVFSKSKPQNLFIKHLHGELQEQLYEKSKCQRL